MSDHDEILAAAKNLRSLIVAARDQGERMRRVPPHIVDALAGAGLLQMYLPRSMGGPEVPYLTAFQAIEEISAAWVGAGFVGAVVGAVILLAIYHFVKRRSARAVSVGIESGFPMGAERRSLG